MEKYYKNEIKKLHDVFKDRWLQIPEYQRPYQWDSENITKLLDDIINPYFINLKKHSEERPDFSDNKPSFCGSIILTEESNNKNLSSRLWNVRNNNPLSIIDGQQRTITFTLIIFSLISKTYYLEERIKSDIDDAQFIGSGLQEECCKVLASVRKDLEMLVLTDIELDKPKWKKEGNQVNGYKGWCFDKKVKLTHRLFREEDSPASNNYNSELSAFLQIFAYKNRSLNYVASDSDDADKAHIDSIKNSIDEVLNFYKNDLDDVSFNKQVFEERYLDNYKTIHSNLNEKLFSKRNDFSELFSDFYKLKNLINFFYDHLNIELHGLGDDQKLKDLSDILKTTSKDEIINKVICDFFLLTSFAGSLMSDVYFSEIICSDEDMALGIFVSLNTSGTPLTVLEQFRPTVYKAAKEEAADSDIRVKESKLIKEFNKVQLTYLNGEENSKPEYKPIKLAEHTAEVGRLLISFMHYYGAKPDQKTGAESKQREFLVEKFVGEEKSEKKPDFNEKLTFLNELWKLADFKRKYWNKLIISNSSLKNQFQNDINSSQEAFFYLRILKETKFELVIPMIHKFEEDLKKTLGDSRVSPDERQEAEKRFNQNIITLSLFTMVYRMAHEDTAGIDDHFKVAMKELNMNFESTRKNIKVSNNDLRKRLSTVLEMNKVAMNNDNEGFQLWYNRVKDKNMYKGAKNKVFVKAINRIVSKYSSCDDKGHLHYSRNTASSEEISFKDLYVHAFKTIDHVIPQKHAASVAKDATEEELIHTFGNLSTVPKEINSCMGDHWELKPKIFRAYTLKKSDAQRKVIKKELEAAGIKISSTVKKIIDGHKDIGERSDLNTHKALAIKVPQNLEEVEKRGEELLNIFFAVARDNIWPKPE